MGGTRKQTRAIIDPVVRGSMFSLLLVVEVLVHPLALMQEWIQTMSRVKAMVGEVCYNPFVYQTLNETPHR